MANDKKQPPAPPSTAEMTIAAGDLRVSLFAGSFKDDVAQMVDAFGPQRGAVSRFFEEEGVTDKELARAVDFLDRRIVTPAPPKGPSKP